MCIISTSLLYLQPSLKGGNGEQSEILLLLGITHQVNIDQLLHLERGGVRDGQIILIFTDETELKQYITVIKHKKRRRKFVI